MLLFSYSLILLFLCLAYTPPHPSLPHMNLLVKPLTGVLGIILTIAGIAGFFMGTGMLFIFEVDSTQSIMYVISGLIGLLAYKSSQLASRWYLLIFGILYGVFAVIGFTMGGDVIGLFMTNSAGNWLHLGIATACLIVSLGSGK